jgi:hypothetical protein
MEMATNQKVVDVLDIAKTVPPLPDDLVDRESSVKTIERMFHAGVEVILLDGPEGIGKTTLARQFAQKNATTTIALFLRAIGPSALNTQNILLDLCDQIQWLLTGARLPESAEADPSLLNQLWLRLERKVAPKNKTCYVLVDGLNALAADWANVRDAVVMMLPLGRRAFKLLITGEAEEIFGDREHQFHFKPYTMDSFSPHETEQYLAEFKLDGERLTELFRVTEGIPARLASVKRILSSGREPRDVIVKCDRSLQGFFSLEWESANLVSRESLREGLAFLAFDERCWSVGELSAVLGMPPEDLRREFSNYHFITIDEFGKIQYVSEAFRSFAQWRLEGLRDATLNKIVDGLIARHGSPQALVSLPSYLERVGRDKEILPYLSAENLDQILGITKTLSAVLKNLDIGIRISQRERLDEDFFALTTIRSLLADIYSVDAWKDEVNALLALGKYDDALTLATSASLTEDQIQLFCILARWSKQNTDNSESVLRDRIQALYKKVDPLALGYNKAIDIAGDLFSIFPDLAIDLVTKSVGADESENALDWALTSLSVVAANKEKSARGVKDTLELLREKITSGKAKNIFSVASVLVGPVDADEVVTAARKIERTSDRLLVLRQWIVENCASKMAGRVIEYAIDAAIAETQFSPNASFYADISTGLKGVAADDECRQLITLLDGQRSNALNKGPTHEYVRFQLNVVFAQEKLDKGESARRLEDLYWEVYGISDPAVRCNCLARMLSAIELEDPGHELEREGQFHSSIREDLLRGIELLLTTTAEHYEVTKGVLEPLSAALPDMAFEIAGKLNVEERRDAALADVIERIASSGTLDAKILRNAIEHVTQIVNWKRKDSAILALASGMADCAIDPATLAGCLSMLRPNIETMASVQDRCRALTYVFLCAKKSASENCGWTIREIEIALSGSWSQIASPWQKISAAFEVATALAKVAPDVAEAYAKRADEVRHTSRIQTSGAADTVNYAVDLMVEAAHGLIVSNAMSATDLEVLSSCLDQLECPREKAVWWARIACCYHLAGMGEEVKRIVANKVLPSIMGIDQSDLETLSEAVVLAAPALWCAQTEICSDELKKIPDSDRDRALVVVGEFLLHKALPGVPYQDEGKEPSKISYADIRASICVLEKMQSDVAILSIVKLIADVTHWGGKRNQLTKEQVGNIASKLELALKGKLPNARQIRHHGYDICCRAHIGRIKGEKAKSFWNGLIADAKGIPNLADAAFVMTVLAETMPAAVGAMRSGCLDKAAEYIRSMPSEHDRMDRFQMVVDAAVDIDGVKARALMQESISGISTSEDRSLVARRRRMIDLAYRIDKDLPSSLASISDDDPARASLKRDAKHVAHAQELMKILSDEKKELPERIDNGMEYANSAWKLLGKLNARRISPVHIGKARDILWSARAMPLHVAYPLLALAFANIVRMYGGNPGNVHFIRDAFRGATRMVRFALMVLERSSALQKKGMWNDLRKSQSSRIVEAGSRTEVIDWMRAWFQSIEGTDVIICDPYFSVEDLAIVRLLQEVKPQAEVQVLCCLGDDDGRKVGGGVSREIFRAYWLKHISDAEPPMITVVRCVSLSGKCVIHDRWVIAENKGFKIGTSLSALGNERLSEITTMDSEHATEVGDRLMRYLTMREKYVQGERIMYQAFTVGEIKT